MNKTYYIFRHRVGVPSHLDVCLADEKNGSNFIFQTKDAAQRCLEKEFRNRRAFHDQKIWICKALHSVFLQLSVCERVPFLEGDSFLFHITDVNFLRLFERRK